MLFARGGKFDKIARKLLEVRIALKGKIRELEFLRDYYIRQAAKNLKAGNRVEAELNKRMAVEYERARMMLLKNLHRIEAKRERVLLGKDLWESARILRKVGDYLKFDEANERVIKALSETIKDEMKEEAGKSALEEALAIAELSPEEAEKLVDSKLKSLMEEEVRPEREAERLRREIEEEIKEV